MFVLTLLAPHGVLDANPLRLLWSSPLAAAASPILYPSLPPHSDTWGHNHDFRLQSPRPELGPKVSDCGFGISIPHSAFRNLKSSSRFPLRDGPQVVPSALAQGLEVGAAPDDPLGGLPHGLPE